jgi:hypothetical protein
MGYHACVERNAIELCGPASSFAYQNSRKGLGLRVANGPVRTDERTVQQVNNIIGYFADLDSVWREGIRHAQTQHVERAGVSTA